MHKQLNNLINSLRAYKELVEDKNALLASYYASNNELKNIGRELQAEVEDLHRQLGEESQSVSVSVNVTTAGTRTREGDLQKGRKVRLVRASSSEGTNNSAFFGRQSPSQAVDAPDSARCVYIHDLK